LLEFHNEANGVNGHLANYVRTQPQRHPQRTKPLNPVFTPVFNPGGFSMNKNVGGIDRTIRITVGLALIAAAATSTVGMWGYVGVVPLLTGLMGWCPPYALLGFNSCAIKNK
jgi:hypothetical protein